MKIEQIKKVLKERGITYNKLADMTGLSLSTVTKIFGGYAKYPRVDTMEAIEKALGIDESEEDKRIKDIGGFNLTLSAT